MILTSVAAGSPFPPWLCERMPILAESHQYGLYRWLSERRGWRRDLAGVVWVALADVASLYLSASLFLLLMLSLAQVVNACLWVVALPILLEFGRFAAIAIGSFRRIERFPLRLADAFGRHATNAWLAEQLLAALPARDVLLALYLECAERRAAAQWIVIVCAVSLGLTAAIGADAIVLLPALAVAAWRLWRLLVVLGVHYARSIDMQRRIEFWSGGISFWNMAMGGIERVAIPAAWLAAVAVPLVGPYLMFPEFESSMLAHSATILAAAGLMAYTEAGLAQMENENLPATLSHALDCLERHLEEISDGHRGGASG